jgi:prevent-host-death family protein
MKIVNIHEAKTHLSALLRLVLKGEKILIAKNNKPIAEIRPLQKNIKPRKPGLLRGKMKLNEEWESADKEIEQLILSSDLLPEDADTD